MGVIIVETIPYYRFLPEVEGRITDRNDFSGKTERRTLAVTGRKGIFKKHRADILLIAGLLLAGLIIAAVLFLTPGKGAVVEVRVSGQVVRTFSLEDTVTYEIEGASGGRNLLRIENGKAWIEEADCPDRLCVNMGRISRAGQSVVCLPHEVVVAIVGERDAADAVSG